MESRLQRRLTVILRDYGYRYDGGYLFQNGINRYTCDRVIRKFSSILSAAEYLIPIIANKDYSDRIAQTIKICMED